MGLYGGIKDSWKNLMDKTGIDNLVTRIPGSGRDASNAAKVAAVLAGGYLAAPYVASAMGGAAGATGAASAVPVTEAGFSAGSLPAAGGNWVAGTGGGGGVGSGGILGALKANPTMQSMAMRQLSGGGSPGLGGGGRGQAQPYQNQRSDIASILYELQRRQGQFPQGQYAVDANGIPLAAQQ